MVTLRKRFPLQPAFRDPLQSSVPIVGRNADLGPGGTSSHGRVSGGADTIGQMQPPNKANLSGLTAWSKKAADPDRLPPGQRPPLRKGGWKSMSIGRDRTK